MIDEAQSGNLDNLKDKLNCLAIDLATNYCTASFGENEKKKAQLGGIFEDILLKNPLFYETIKNFKPAGTHGFEEIKDMSVADLTQHRNILIIGAGATYDSYKCVPLGREVVEKFEKK